MPFDWSKVEGYDENMSAEEKLALLETLSPKQDENPTPTPEPEEPKQNPSPKMISKAMYDKVSSELANAKKQLMSKMTEDEKREAERVAEQEDMRKELEMLRHDKTLSSYKASYLSLGYDEKLASEAANAKADGNSDMEFEILRRHLAMVEKNLRAQILKETPVPPAGDEANDEAKKLRETNELRRSFGLPPLR